ncbi:MAG: 16S rRNA (guanine(966)-N(2))-methyltransferase RsmD [Gammaproteobacteria bacterium]|nr:16S rRNA (guanine(966)-N(2))-methyltransferase RsmD [Gammaproteobacteria bacterium]
MAPARPKPGAAAGGSGRLRIIGGRWRSRRIEFAAAAGVRPTADRIRETLFNWLRDIIPGARCLDLYAGSGALGFEALSRGAHRVVFVDQDVRVIQQLQANAELLGTQDAEIVWSDALEYLAACRSGPFDVVFLDPPFRDDVIKEACLSLERYGLLSSPAWVYLETDHRLPPPGLPDNWRRLHDKSAGQVAYRMARRDAKAG